MNRSSFYFCLPGQFWGTLTHHCECTTASTVQTAPETNEQSLCHLIGGQGSRWHGPACGWGSLTGTGVQGWNCGSGFERGRSWETACRWDPAGSIGDPFLSLHGQTWML